MSLWRGLPCAFVGLTPTAPLLSTSSLKLASVSCQKLWPSNPVLRLDKHICINPSWSIVTRIQLRVSIHPLTWLCKTLTLMSDMVCYKCFESDVITGNALKHSSGARLKPWFILWYLQLLFHELIDNLDELQDYLVFNLSAALTGIRFRHVSRKGWWKAQSWGNCKPHMYTYKVSCRLSYWRHPQGEIIHR